MSSRNDMLTGSFNVECRGLEQPRSARTGRLEEGEQRTRDGRTPRSFSLERVIRCCPVLALQWCTNERR
jgi:hypothetical protein